MTAEIIDLPPSLYWQAAELCGRAYLDDPAIPKAIEHLAPEKRLEIVSNYWSLFIRFTARYGTIRCICEDEKLVAVNLFYTPKQYPPPNHASYRLLAQILKLLTPVLGIRGCLHHYRTTVELLRRQPNEPHFYTELTCVDPKFQKRGYYTLLKREMDRRADEAGVGIYGETSNAPNARILQKYGFQITEEAMIGNVKYWFLWRKPAKPK